MKTVILPDSQTEDDAIRDLRERIREFAIGLGFDACGFASVEGAPFPSHLGVWLDRGFHADMEWMARSRGAREDIRTLLPGARTVIVVAKNYFVGDREVPEGHGRVARYAWGRDYHRALKKPMLRLGRFVESCAPDVSTYHSIDSRPVLERTWAELAGVGWIGKNGLVLRRDIGSWFFLATLATTLELPGDATEAPACGTCRACVEQCPTGAIGEDKSVDSAKCISYQTIENRYEIPTNIHKNIADWVFGCDVCQEVCPWNRFAVPSQDADFAPRDGHVSLDPKEVKAMDAEAFDSFSRGSPLRRAGLEGLRRNAEIVLRNFEGV